MITILVNFVGHIVEDAKVSSKLAVPAIHVEEEAHYAQSYLNEQSSFYAEAGMPTPYYKLGTATEVNMTCDVCCPTMLCDAGYV